MARTVKLSRLGTVLDDHDYPTTRAAVADRFEEVTVLLADGEANLGTAIEALPSEEYESAEDLETELYSELPIEAVGEPGQSEGEG